MADDGFLECAGSTLMELVDGDGTQAEVPCVGRILCDEVTWTVYHLRVMVILT